MRSKFGRWLPFLPFVLATTEISSSTLVSHIEEKSLTRTLWDLSEIARQNGGNRAFGLPGYRASADYIINRVQQLPGVTVQEQEFEALFSIVEDIELKVVGEEPVHVHGLTYSPSTSREGLTAELVLGPDGDAGCRFSGYKDLDVRDKIVLVQRFRCPDQTTLAGRVRPAVRAGAAAVLIYHDSLATPASGGLNAPDPVGYRPAGFVDLATGQAWKARLQAGERVEVFFKHLQTIENRKTWNVIAESRDGDPDTVIVLGAHLDSVQAGAGINDDGSGTSLILEVLSAASQYRTHNKLRFIWWGAEESGLLGSMHYVSSLAPKQLANVLAYVNFDMVARGYFGVFDGNGDAHGLAGPAGSDIIEDLFAEYLEEQEQVTVTPAAFTGGSDYAGFMSRGIPVGGLHTGTGFDQDPCYHQSCDGFDNHNSTVLFTNAKAAAHVLGRLAMDGHKLIPRWSETNAYSEADAQGIFRWSVEESEDGVVHVHD